MNRTVRATRGIEILAGLIFLSAVVGTIAWFWSRRPTIKSLADQRASRAAGLTYAPRVNIDSSGFQMFRDGLPHWPRESAVSLPEIGKIWQAQCQKCLDLANGPTPAARLGSPQDFEYVIAQVLVANCEGRPARAYQLLEQLRASLVQIPPMAEKSLYTVIYLQGVTSLRLGEDENCIVCRGDSSCILPINPAARHTKPRGSRQAIRHFTEYLEQFPEDFGVRWLLNLAHATLGEHPEQVDPRYLLTMEVAEDPANAIGAFQEVGARVGVNRHNHAGGGIMDDFDNDGWLDIVTTAIDASKPMALFRNNTRGTFDECAAEARITDQTGGLYCVQADFNNDGFLDIFIPRGAWLHSPVRPSLLTNNGDGTFSDITVASGLLEPASSNSASWADYDNDGFLDLYVCCERQPNRLYRNLGNGSFHEAAAEVGVQGSLQPMCKAGVWIDQDNDDDQDLFLNYFGGTAIMFRNDGLGGFQDVTTSLGIDGPEKGFSSWAWDYDNDGWLDIFATCYDQTLDDVVRGVLGQPHQRKSNRLFRNQKGQRFEDKTRAVGLDVVFSAMGTNYGDFDNDGYLDMYLGTGEPRYDFLVPNRMLRNLKGERFAEITASSRTGHLQKGHGVACGDWNRDGQTDLFVETGGASTGDRAHNLLFQNPGHPNAWVTLRLVGRQTNRSASGARIKIVTSSPDQQTFYHHVSSGSTFGANSLELNIGLGKAEKIDLLEIHWPSSQQTQRFQDLDVRQVLVIGEGAEKLYPQPFTAVQPPPAKEMPAELVELGST